MPSTHTIIVTPCFSSPGAKGPSSWTIQDKVSGMVHGSSRSLAGAERLFANVVSDLVASGSRVNYTIFSDTGRGVSSSGHYDAKGVNHPSGSKPAASTVKPAASTKRVTFSDKGGRGVAHPGLHTGASGFRKYIDKAMKGGMSYEAALSAWRTKQGKPAVKAAKTPVPTKPKNAPKPAAKAKPAAAKPAPAKAAPAKAKTGGKKAVASAKPAAAKPAPAKPAAAKTGGKKKTATPAKAKTGGKKSAASSPGKLPPLPTEASLKKSKAA